MGINFFNTYWELAESTYHVNPLIFVTLMTISVPPYYWGWFALAKEAIDFRKRYKDKNNSLKLTDILAERGFLLPLTINRAAWVMPYVYVIFWGKNIPVWFWFLFFGWIGFSAYLFWNKLKQKISEEK